MIIIALLDFTLAAFNAMLAANSFQNGSEALGVNIFAVVFCFGAGLAVLFSKR